MRNPTNIALEGHQVVSLHDAALIVLLRSRLAQIERKMATYLHEVDGLTGTHFHLSKSLADVQRRAYGEGGRNA
jgi:hypothetical protein